MTPRFARRRAPSRDSRASQRLAGADGVSRERRFRPREPSTLGDPSRRRSRGGRHGSGAAVRPFATTHADADRRCRRRARRSGPDARTTSFADRRSMRYWRSTRRFSCSPTTARSCPRALLERPARRPEPPPVAPSAPSRREPDPGHDPGGRPRDGRDPDADGHGPGHGADRRAGARAAVRDRDRARSWRRRWRRSPPTCSPTTSDRGSAATSSPDHSPPKARR